MPRGRPAVKVACRLCHDRRVKCDRSEGVACTNCRNARRDCVPIVSRRGRRRKLPLLPSKGLAGVSHHVPYQGAMASTSPSTTPHTQAETEKRHPEQYFPTVGVNGETPYVGDSSNLNYLMQQVGNPFAGRKDIRPVQDHLQGAMLARLGRSTTQEIERLRIATRENLQRQGAFDLPSHETSQALLDVYFQYSLLALPILDRSSFLAALNQGKCSHLLLNAIYLVATIYCSDSVISEAGFASRYAASLTFYQRAKSLYDAGYETDAITTIQATFLFCHWWGGLFEQKDPWYWLSVSTGMAQALGMHQAKSYTRLNDKDRKVWRRLWWIVYTMDIHLSMLLDRPPHVQGRLCNVPPLSEADFEQVDEPKAEALSEANTYWIHAVRLAQTVDRFFAIKFNEDSGHQQDACLEQIALWASALPTALSTTNGMAAILAQLLYQEYRLLLHRSNPRFSGNTGPGTPTFEICTEISNLLELLIANDLVYPAAASILPPVLSVLSIHLVNIRRGDPGVKTISEHRANFCMMILDKLQDRFPIVAAFYPIYESRLKRNGTGAQRADDLGVREESAAGLSIPDGSRRVDNQSDFDTGAAAESWFDQGLLDSMSTTLPFSFPFGNLFEDIFLDGEEMVPS